MIICGARRILERLLFGCHSYHACVGSRWKILAEYGINIST